MIGWNNCPSDPSWKWYSKDGFYQVDIHDQEYWKYRPNKIVVGNHKTRDRLLFNWSYSDGMKYYRKEIYNSSHGIIILNFIKDLS